MNWMSTMAQMLRKDKTVVHPAPADSHQAEGSLTATQVALVQATWEQVVPIADQAARLFYGKLFDLDPHLKGLFKTDMEAQGQKLTQMLTVAVRGLSHLEAIVPAVQQLGKRHVTYGVQDEHYDTVATALLWTLEQGLGAAFTPEVKTAWSVTYTVLANTMKSATHEV